MENLLNILRLVSACQSVDGRKKLQKMVYILQECGYPFHERYTLHLFGPYSGELKHEIDMLVGDLLEERVIAAGAYPQYTYQPHAEAARLLARFPSPDAAQWTPLAIDLNRRSAQDLEAISTALYLRRHGFEGERLRQQFVELKPNLAAQFDDANRHVESLIAHQQLAN